jgi:hypothetical protein
VENGHGANWKEMATHYSVDALKRYLQATFMLVLSSAPFDTADPALNPKMGACTDCSYNTGNLGALFVGMKEARCTVPECFQIKTNKSLLNEIDAVGKETGKKVFRLGIGSEYQNRGLSKNMVDGYFQEHSREIVEVAVGKECEFTLPAVVTFVDPTLGIKSTPGKRLLICADEKCKTHRGESQRAGLAPRKGIELVDHKEKNLKISLGQRARTQAYQQLAIKLLAKPVIVLASAREESFAALLKYVQNHLYIDRFRDAGKAIGLERPAKREFGGPDWEKAVVKHFGDNRSALVLALVAAEGIQDSDRKNALYRIAAEHKVDVPKIEKSIAAEDKALIAAARERAKEKSSGEPKAAKKASPKKSTPKKKVAKKT